ncbi:MAG: hypothetical protein ACLQFR_08460 [Streptosporangiaceae bacterium]
MNGIAVLAAKGTAVVPGFGSALLAPSAVDGFAAGTLLTGVCVLIVMGRRRRRRRPPPSSETPPVRVRLVAKAAPAATDTDCAAPMLADPGAENLAGAFVLPATPELSITPDLATTPVPPAAPELPAAAELPAAPELLADTVPSAPLAPAAAPELSAAFARRESGLARDGLTSGYRSKHRMSHPDAGEWRPESRRTAPRHAAPSPGLGFSSLADRIPMHPLPVRD